MSRESALARAYNWANLHIGPMNRRADYLLITEGRGEVAGYGWCGDFVTAVLECEGVADPAILNRVSVAGSWKVGDNIARIQRAARARGAYTQKQLARPGDILILGSPNGGHICFFGRWLSATSYESVDGNLGPAMQSDVRQRSVSGPTYPLYEVVDFELLTGSAVPLPAPPIDFSAALTWLQVLMGADDSSHPLGVF